MSPSRPKSAQPLSAAEALQLLEQHARQSQDVLASRTDAGPEVLNYLAENGAAATRRAVAANPATPAETNWQLADDIDKNVRKALAGKIGRLFPGLLAEEEKQLRDLTFATLEKLARDEVSEVRAILADEIKAYDCVPKTVVEALANDADPKVALPVIEFSPLLDDRDLIELVAATRASAILSAVARRKHLSGDVSDAVATTLDIDAVAALLANTDAAIRTKTLDRIISQAAEVAEWHSPLVVRADLSKSAIRRLATFVGTALIDTLAARSGLDEATRTHLKSKLEERRSTEAAAEAAVIEAARKAGTLNEAFVAEAVEECRKETVVKALSVLAKTDELTVRRVLDSRSAKGAIALVWHAGLSMRVAFKLQTQVMRLSGKDLVPARHGIDFPLDEDEMRWHLGYFGIS
ncbi:DUF2336 domain-containing protein [Rhizomicrobium electricum]|uniref:DUF2336 domain-containing protein n=1 Tax=Rhizomicrobium electricum TaxID=480070 RepID=A0ABP3QAD9_9PROT|nr:uncharacterized protein (DUF2336 family) [Rhizomicrobium electricum]